MNFCTDFPDVVDVFGSGKKSAWHFAHGQQQQQQLPLTEDYSRPSVSGGTVLGLVFRNGVAICADTLGSYGRLARYGDCDRVVRVNDRISLGAAGDIADFQYLRDFVEQEVLEEESLCDGIRMAPRSLMTYLTRVLYGRRTQMRPLWNVYVVGGLSDGDKPFLGTVDLIGTAFEGEVAVTGRQAHQLVRPILEDAREKDPDMTAGEAKKKLFEAMCVLQCRDTRAFPKIKFAVVTSAGVEIDGPHHVEPHWFDRIFQN